MSSAVPTLDTVDFDELVERARGQIPRYAPAWTDHNVHDPGMTVIDLLAWIVDQEVYRIGFVGDRHLAAFATLLGAEHRGPTPARGLIWPDRPLDVGRSIRQGATVTAVRTPEIPFELDVATYLTAARLTGMVLSRGADVWPTPNEGVRTPPILLGPSDPRDPPSLLLQFDRPLVVTAPATVSIGFEVERAPGAPPDGTHRWGPLSLRYRQGDAIWLDAPIVRDDTAALSVTGAIAVEIPVSASGSQPSELRVSLDLGHFPIAIRLRRVEINVLPVVQRETVLPAVIDVGTGLPDQVVAFDTSGVVDGSTLEIRVDDDPWAEVDQFEDSGPDDLHYRRRTDGLVFGNGVNGRRPAHGAQIHHRGLVRTVGEHGNLRAGLSWRVPALGTAGEAYGTNPRATDGGASSSDLDQLLAEARETATQRRVLLTDDDLREAAIRLPGFAVARAEVLDGFRPDAPDRHFAGTRTLVVIPHPEPADDAASADDRYLDEVRRMLGDRRVLGERLFVAGHRVVRIDVALIAAAEPGADPDTVAQAIGDRLRARLSVVTRRDDVSPWPLGRAVTCGEIASIAARTDGVLAVTSCHLARAEKPVGEVPVDLARDELAVLDDSGLHIEVTRT